MLCHGRSVQISDGVLNFNSIARIFKLRGSISLGKKRIEIELLNLKQLTLSSSDKDKNNVENTKISNSESNGTEATGTKEIMIVNEPGHNDLWTLMRNIRIRRKYML